MIDVFEAMLIGLHARREITLGAREQKPERDDERGGGDICQHGRGKRWFPESTVRWLVLLRLRCYCPHDAIPMTRIGDRARMGRRIPGQAAAIVLETPIPRRERYSIAG